MTATRRRRQVERINRAVRDLERLRALLERAWYACDLTLPSPYGSGGGEHVSGGDVSRPTESVVVGIEAAIDSRLAQVPALDDDGTDLGFTVEEARDVGMAALETNLTVIERALAEARNELTRLAAPLVRRDPPPRTNVVDCRACERPVANTPDDRLRSGYCNACRMAWNRQGQPDRAMFERNRPKHNGERVSIKTRDAGQGPVVELRNGAGQQVHLPTHLAEEFARLDIDAQRTELARFLELAVEWWEAQA